MAHTCCLIKEVYRYFGGVFMFNWFKKLIDTISKTNDDEFKGQKLDCCDLNRKTPQKEKK
jgi:hypothetical protein